MGSGVTILYSALRNTLRRPDLAGLRCQRPGGFPGRPVLLRWTRANENQWEPYSPAAVLKLQASLDAEGKIVGWNHDVYSPPHLGRSGADPDSSGLLAAEYLEKLPAAIDLMARREKVLLDAAKRPGFDIEKLKQAMSESAAVK